MIDKNKLCRFLVEAKKWTYASLDSATKIQEKDKSTTLIFENWDWKYHDNYFGGEPYGWREVVFFKNKPIYIMTYYWRINKWVPNIWEVYKTLQDALFLITKENPYRGPTKYIKWDYIYKNEFVWEVDGFSGEEIIIHNEKEVYKAKYMWWFVDQR